MDNSSNGNKNGKQEDFEAIERVLAGDESAYDILQKKYRRIIAALIRRMVRDEDDVDDLVQESFIKAFGALPKFQFNYSFSAWLYRIASNTCIDFLRRKRFKTISINNPVKSSDEEMEYEIEDNSYIPDYDVMHEERRRAIAGAIESLPENYRVIIKLRHEEEMEYAEIARRLDLPLGTVKAHLFRARKMLHDMLKKKVHLFQDE
ncbi:MAG: RNA polymerase sigma factor [Candidatus Kapaibacterium sp.]